MVFVNSLLISVGGGSMRDEASYSRATDAYSNNYDDDMDDRYAQVN